MMLRYQRATIEDIDILTETRIEVLRAANLLSDHEDMSEVKGQSYHYYSADDHAEDDWIDDDEWDIGNDWIEDAEWEKRKQA